MDPCDPSVERTRSVFWRDGALMLIDQPKLPGSLQYQALTTVPGVETAIRTMVVRGAPAIGAAAGFGMAIGAQAALDAGAELV